MIPSASRYNETFSILNPDPIVDNRGGMRLNFTVVKTGVRGKKLTLNPLRSKSEGMINDQIQDHQYAHFHLNKSQAQDLVQGKSRIRERSGKEWDVLNVWDVDNLLMTYCVDAEPSQP